MTGRRVALALWLAATFVVWNAVFDRVLVYAGRAYVEAAKAEAVGSGPYPRIDDSMRPALARALVLASAAAGAMAAVGLVAFRLSARTTSTESLRKT